MRVVGPASEAGGTRGARERVQALLDEQRRSQRLEALVDCTIDLITHERMTRVQAEALVDTTRTAVLDLFPGSEATYNLLLGPRFARLIDHCVGPASGRPLAKVIPFPTRPPGTNR